MEENKKRFIVKEKCDIGYGTAEILVDTKTGVNYLNIIGGGVNGLTPLYDENGYVIVDK